MKKVFYVLFLFMLLVGCSSKNESGILKELEKKVEKADSYNLVGTLEMINNENSHIYDVEVSYMII